jgi:phage replication-related protein YjqB (UPF0714/DUF867 family)
LRSLPAGTRAVRGCEPVVTGPPDKVGLIDIAMGIRTSLSKDPTSAALNTRAHASEHCAVDGDSLDALGGAVGRQVLIRRSPKRLALYTVAELVELADRAAHVGTVGLTRLEHATDELPATLRATIETDFTSGDSGAPVRLVEQLLGRAATGLAVLAPHGGKIEVGTDDQATLVFRVLAHDTKPVRAWIARGFNPTGAHRCWHITASEISEQSFPKLGALFGRGASRGPFAHAIAFHGQNDSDAIIVGGGLPQDPKHTALKMRLRSQISEALQALDDPPAVVVRRSGPLAGAERANIVNRVTLAGNGIQLEQPASARTVKEQRDAIARAVAAFYADLV